LPVTYKPKVEPRLTLTGQQSAVKLHDKNCRQMQLVLIDWCDTNARVILPRTNPFESVRW